jgi:ABC-2 type transport system ATP-binding protein
LTARENLRFFGGLQGMRGRSLDARIAATLEMVGLADRADDRIDAYSGGMQRRANIAVGLLHEPQLLILDEPTAGVDPQSRNQILESIEGLSEAGLSVLYTTHYMEEAERLCDRVGVIDDGRLVAEGTRRELIAKIGEHDRILLRGDDHLAEFADRVRSLAGVAGATFADRTVEVTADDAASVLARVITCAGEAGMSVTGVEVREPNLESVFLHLTGKALRDRVD